MKNILILGGDGYFGWNLGLALANRTNLNVILLDSLVKRQWEKEVNCKPLFPCREPKERISEYTRIFGKTNLSFEKLDLLDYDSIVKILKKYKPFCVVNAAQQPSAPFSMMNAKNAAYTFHNNVIGHQNTLWAITEVDKNITCIKLGSAGCYSSTDTSFIPLDKVDFSFEHEGKQQKILKSWLPMNASDFYHQSKITDFLISDLAADIWKLKIVTVQQSTIFGSTIEENFPIENHGLSARFNYDSVFGTVINRFACQITIGEPLTIYGDGDQITGFISLPDTIDNFINIIKDVDSIPTGHSVIHNYTTRLSINEIAEIFKKIDNMVKINHVKNPRKEMNGSLERKVENHKTILNSHKNDTEKEKEFLKLLEFTKIYKNNIDKSMIYPNITWEKSKIDDLIHPGEMSDVFSGTTVEINAETKND